MDTLCIMDTYGFIFISINVYKYKSVYLDRICKLHSNYVCHVSNMASQN